MNAPVRLPGDGKVGRRGSPRLRLHVPAELVLVDGQTSCLLDDISRTGASLTVPRPVFRGADGLLRCGGLELFGAIVWTRHGRCGLAFDEPLPQSVVLALRTIEETLHGAEIEARRRAARDWVGG